MGSHDYEGPVTGDSWLLLRRSHDMRSPNHERYFTVGAPNAKYGFTFGRRQGNSLS